jgi:Fe-S cluster assembly protein SufD
MENMHTDTKLHDNANIIGSFNAERFAKQQSNLDLPELIAGKMSEMYGIYENLPMPHRSMEEWRRTDISRVKFDKFGLWQPQSVTEVAVPEHLSGIIVIADDGVKYGLSEEVRAAGVKFGPVMQVLSNSEHLQNLINGIAVSPEMMKFHAWNMAFFNTGFALDVPPNTLLEKPFDIVIEGAFDEHIVMMRNIMNTAANATAVVNLRWNNTEETQTMVINVDEMYADANSRLEYNQIQNLSKKSYFFGIGAGLQQTDSAVQWTQINMGGELHKSYSGGLLDGKGAEARLNGCYFGEQRQHFDMRTMQMHHAPHTYSNLLFKGAVKEKAHTVYQGMIQVQDEAQHIDAYQTNNNLILNDGARADSIPGLEIHADDVSCSHGATVGHINDEELFYLQSRGIHRDEAERILVTGFFEAIIERMQSEYMRDMAHNLIESKMD